MKRKSARYVLESAVRGREEFSRQTWVSHNPSWLSQGRKRPEPCTKWKEITLKNAEKQMLLRYRTGYWSWPLVPKTLAVSQAPGLAIFYSSYPFLSTTTVWTCFPMWTTVWTGSPASGHSNPSLYTPSSVFIWFHSLVWYGMSFCMLWICCSSWLINKGALAYGKAG